MAGALETSLYRGHRSQGKSWHRIAGHLFHDQGFSTIVFCANAARFSMHSFFIYGTPHDLSKTQSSPSEQHMFMIRFAQAKAAERTVKPQTKMVTAVSPVHHLVKFTPKVGTTVQTIPLLSLNLHTSLVLRCIWNMISA